MKKTNIKRRNFLLGLGLGGVGAAAMVLTGKQGAVVEEVAVEAAAPQGAKGYHLSEHVQTYYRKASI